MYTMMQPWRDYNGLSNQHVFLRTQTSTFQIGVQCFRKCLPPVSMQQKPAGRILQNSSSPPNTQKSFKNKSSLKTPVHEALIKQKAKKQFNRKVNSAANEEDKVWRLLNVEVDVAMDPGKDSIEVEDQLHFEVAKKFGIQVDHLPRECIRIVRKAFDARKDLKFVYAVEMDEDHILAALRAAKVSLNKLRPIHNRLLRVTNPNLTESSMSSSIREAPALPTPLESKEEWFNPRGPPAPGVPGKEGMRGSPRGEKLRVVVVGSGPAGLFAALTLAESRQVNVILLERGQPVEVRGRDIGALVVRRQVDADSNFCYGEGGAGTWSDGKLTTRIGRNSDDVQAILRTLVKFGAPERTLVDSKPHLGTDRLVKILRNFREHLVELGVEVRFGAAMESLEIQPSSGRITGVAVRSVQPGRQSNPQVPPGDNVVPADAVVLAIGHSARDAYSMLSQQGVKMKAKDFAVGFRVEHPQELINGIQYGSLASMVERGKGKVPVADYSLAMKAGGVEGESEGATRGCYSFCMCPGGQVVPTSTNPDELCVNGMSFSKRSSKWANAALVAAVSADDFKDLVPEFGPMAGMEFQRKIEREAAIRGGGDFVVPVQRVTDFLENRVSCDPLPSSSYRLGVRSANLHDIYPSQITTALQEALLKFDRQLPGFICDSGLLHGVETRTSAPICIERDRETFESTSMAGLYPIGEGAGYAGGIVSAAVDGMKAGQAILQRVVKNFTQCNYK